MWLAGVHMTMPGGKGLWQGHRKVPALKGDGLKCVSIQFSYNSSHVFMLNKHRIVFNMFIVLPSFKQQHNSPWKNNTILAFGDIGQKQQIPVG